MTTANYGRLFMSKLIEFCNRTGYLAPNFHEATGDFSCCTTGPLGTQMKYNLLQEWWKAVVVNAEENMFGVSSATASGIQLQNEDIKNEISNKCGEDNHAIFSLRSSLSFSTFSHFPQILQLLGGRLPFGIAQWGICHSHSDLAKCLGDQMLSGKNEHSQPKNFNLSLPAEHTELFIQFFSSSSSSVQWFDYWHRKRLLWWRKFAGTPSDFTLTEISSSEKQTNIEIQYLFPWSPVTVEKITNLNSIPFDSLPSEQNIKVKDGRKLITPHVIEITSSLELAILIYLVDGYKEKEEKKEIVRKMRLHHKIAPYKVTIASTTASGNTAQMKDLIIFLTRSLRKAGLNVLYFPDNISTSLERQFSRSDEMGIPYSLVLNDITLKNGILGLRNRDTTLKEQVHVAEVKNLLLKYLK